MLLQNYVESMFFWTSKDQAKINSTQYQQQPLGNSHDFSHRLRNQPRSWSTTPGAEESPTFSSQHAAKDAGGVPRGIPLEYGSGLPNTCVNA